MSGWPTARLGDVIREYPKSTLKVRDAKGEGPYPFFTSGATVSAHDEYLADGANIFMATGGKASVQYYEGKVAYSTDCYAFTTADDVDPKFAFHFLNSMIDRIDREMFKGAALRHLQKGDLREVRIPRPDRAVQAHVVAMLDAELADLAAAQDNTANNTANLKTLFLSQIHTILGRRSADWSDFRLRDVAKEFGRGKSRHRPRNEPGLYGGPYPFIQTGDISRADHWLTEYTQTYSELGLAQSRLWPRGTICVAIVGATVGESAILDFDACFPDSVIGIVVDEDKADCEYVEYLLQAHKMRLKERGKGTARDNINLGTFEREAFPFPPLEEQKQIAGQLNALRAELTALAQIYNDKVAELCTLRASLLHHALAGKLNGAR